jgi:predicted amidohydrolase
MIHGIHKEGLTNMKKLTMALLATTIALGLQAATPVQAKEIKVATGTFHSSDQAHNIPKMVQMSVDAARNGAKLIVFPEMASTGFLYLTAAEAGPNIDTVPGTATSTFGKVADENNIYIAFGLIEKDPDTGVIFNSAAMVGPKGFVAKYRKNQLAVGDDNIFRAPGNLGFPVFDTEIGKIAMLICYDDSQLQSLLLPALRGAEIIAYPTASLYNPRAESDSNQDHTTIGSMATLPGWMGVNVVGADSSGVDVLVKGKAALIGPGGSTIWNSRGEALASAAVTSWTDPKVDVITYATIDTEAPNPQRDFWLKHRRSELYSDYNFFRPDFDRNVSPQPELVSALLVQYKPEDGAVDKNYATIERLVAGTQQGYNLVVLPFNSLIGDVAVTKDTAPKLAESLNGKSYTLAAGLAKKFNTYLLFSMPEVADGKYYETAVLFDYDGNQVGLYRKSHLNDTEKAWATAGDELPVFDTNLGRIAVVLNDEARIPEVTEIYGIKRANMILTPVAYSAKDYGGPVAIPKGLVPEESNRGMFMWFSMAKMSQAYTLVANYATGAQGDFGMSALYSLVPEEGFFPPRLAPADKDVAYQVNFGTNQNLPLWTSQQDKMIERRWDQALPLTLSPDSECFKEWQANSSSPIVCKGQD